MPKPPIAVVRVVLVVSFVGLLSAGLAVDGCWGADKESAAAAITLDAQNEPLRSVLDKIYKTTRWKIKVHERWMDKPVSQTLNKVAMEEGLRSVLKNAGVENLLLLYDENRKVVTLFDTEGQQNKAASRPAEQATIPQRFVSTTGEPDPILDRANERTPRRIPPRESRRGRRSEEP